MSSCDQEARTYSAWCNVACDPFRWLLPNVHSLPPDGYYEWLVPCIVPVRDSMIIVQSVIELSENFRDLSDR